MSKFAGNKILKEVGGIAPKLNATVTEALEASKDGKSPAGSAEDPISLGLTNNNVELTKITEKSGRDIAIGVASMYTERTRVILEQIFGVTVSNGSDIISTVIGLVEKIMDVWKSLFGSKSKVDKKTKASVEGYKKRVGEIAKLIIPTIEAVGNTTDGLIVTKAEQHVLSNNKFFIDSQLVTSLSSGAYMELNSSAITLNSRHTAAVCDVWQGVHYHFNILANTHIHLESNTALRINNAALKEISAEADYVASSMSIYGDLIWNQAGQISNIPIAKNAPKDIKVNYGCIVNVSQKHQAFLASTGFIVMQARTLFVVDAPTVAINCGWAQVSSAVIPKVVAPLMSNSKAVSEQEATEPNNPVSIDETVKVGAYPEGYGKNIYKPKKK